MSPVDGFAPGHPTTAADGTGGDRQRSDMSVEPQLVRVSVLGGNTQLDVGLPAGIPIAGLIGDLVAQIESRNPNRHDPDDPDADTRGRGRPHDRQNRWTLALVGQEPLPLHRSLSESGIRDGDLLLLTSTRTGESPVLFDDVVDAVARLNESQFVGWTATSARYVGYALALLAAVAAGAGLAASRIDSGALWLAGGSGLAVIGLVTAATIVARYYRDQLTSTILSVCAAPMAFVTGMILTPGSYGAAHLTLGFALTLVTAVITYRMTAVGATAHSAVTSAALVGALGCGARLLLDADISDVAAVVAAVGLLLIGLSPRLTILLAKLPLPPVPTAGAAIDVKDIEPQPSIEGIGAIGATALPKADALERRSYIANAYLTGIVGGLTAVVAIAAVLTAAPLAGFEWKNAAYAAIIGVVLCLRGRSHSDLFQAAILIIGGSLVVLTLLVGLAFGDGQWPIISFALGGVVLVAALVFGVVAPHQDFSPVMRRWAEIGEYILVALIVPLLLWLLDLYRIVRDI
ncbi:MULTISPECIES: type VII secretion integral membrane protein EccD [Gordonia]|uniref:type VII secretion integral membrane protein EccD n=1 Tax=Gordonia TaxID=2053 RepID=UPI0011803096|nr:MULTISPECIES: type VII secretion integral membrane protein EccD [Gordonia]MCK8615925.1 type VII secretion integral membrane protein EccD [Gordonia sp. C13]TSD96908.1 type VII secretion integral membrane protein EccD [Gordonia rubripertincta]